MTPKAWSVIKQHAFDGDRGGDVWAVDASRREPTRAWGLDETSIFNYDSAKTHEGTQYPSGAPMGVRAFMFGHAYDDVLGMRMMFHMMFHYVVWVCILL